MASQALTGSLRVASRSHGRESLTAYPTAPLHGFGVVGALGLPFPFSRSRGTTLTRGWTHGSGPRHAAGFGPISVDFWQSIAFTAKWATGACLNMRRARR
jgi:hypothetical protein